LKKKFLTNLVLLVILNVLIKPFWFFGIEVAVQNRVGEEMYGFYFSLFNFAFILNILLDIGLTNFNNRAIARDHDLLRERLGIIIPLKFLLSIIYGVIVFSLGLIIGYDHLQIKLLAILVLNQFLSSFILYLRSNVSGIQLFTTDSLLSVLDRSLMIIMNGILLWSGLFEKNYRIEWFVYTQTLSYSITALVILIVVLYHSGRIRIRINTKDFLSILRQSYPFAILILLMSFFNRVDSVMIERILHDGKEQAGIYAQSYRVLDAFSQFAVLFAGLLLPMFSKMLKTGENITELIKLSSSLLLGIGLAVAAAGFLFNREIINLMYHSVDQDSPMIFSILMSGFVFIAVSYIYGTLLTANKSLKQLNILAAITVILNISLNLILIPHFYAKGAAIASLSSQSFYAISQVITAKKILNLKEDYGYVFRLLIYAVLVCATGWMYHRFFNWIPAILLFSVTAVLLSVVTGVIRPREILRIFREENE